MRLKIASVALLGVMVAVAGAQAVVPVKSTTVESRSGNRRAYLVKLDGQADYQMGVWSGSTGWESGDRLRTYAKANAGSYVVFLLDGAIYRVSDVKQLQELAPLFEPLRQLGKQQAALGSVQQPLSAQQKALSAEMRATNDPATQGQIGSVQGSIGQVQGEIGRQQGIIGKQQGQLGALLDERVQSLIDTCLREKSCAVVEAAKPGA
jgi:hypothetical protein